MIPAALTYDIWNPKTRANPQALYAQMRREDPIHAAIGPMTGRRFWFFTRYDDCVAVLKDPRFGKELHKHLTPEQLVGQPVSNDEFAVINRHLLDLDPPDHTRLRALVHKGFTPRMIENLRGRIQEIADNLLDTVASEHEIDLLEVYGFPLPITVIAELLGIPASDRDRFRAWTKALLFGLDEEQARVSVLEFAMYMHAMIEERIAFGIAPEVERIIDFLACRSQVFKPPVCNCFGSAKEFIDAVVDVGLVSLVHDALDGDHVCHVGSFLKKGPPPTGMVAPVGESAGWRVI